MKAYKKLKEPEFEYPLFKRWKNDGEIAMYTALNTKEVVWKGKSRFSKDIGHISRHAIPHTDPEWEDVPYNKERDLWDTQPILCRAGADKFGWEIRFYDAINDGMFVLRDGRRSGFILDSIKPLPVSMYNKDIIEAHSKLKL